MTPATLEELAGSIGECDRSGAAVAIRGGDTLRGMGLRPAQPHQTLSTSGLAGIVEDAPADLVICVQAGITVRNLSNALARHGTHVPFDAPLPQTATVGGTLASGWLGPRRHLHGRPRDYLIGSVAVLADGTIARAGGVVVKNVSGYDLSRLYVGSFGTLCVLAQVNLKTATLSSHSRLFVASLPEGTRSRAISGLATLPVAPAAAFCVEGFHQTIEGEDGSEGRVVILLEASAATIERATRDLRSALGRAGVPETRVLDSGVREAFERIVDSYIANLGERSVTYRIAARPDDALPRMLALRALTARFELRSDSILDAMNGDLVLRVSDLDARALASKIQMFDDALHDAEAQAIVIASDHPSRPLLDLWGAPPPGLAQMRALKVRFDPNRTLNPGRFIGGI